MRSKIFDEYVKIAEEQGLVSSDDEISKLASVLPKVAGPTDSRIGSDTEESMALLYGLVPDGQEEGETILDVAHPGTAVVSPAYDPMNGIVETQQERQNMIAYIALKMPTGNINNRRYVNFDGKKYESPSDAYRESSSKLLNSLVKAGFTTDNNDEDELRILADSCATRLEKKAIAPLIWGGVALVSTILAYTSAVNNFPPSQGLIGDVKQAIEELGDAIPEVYDASAKEMQNVSNVLGAFERVIESHYNDSSIPEPTSIEDVSVLINNPSAMSVMHGKAAYVKHLDALNKYLPGAIGRMKAAKEKPDDDSFLGDWGTWGQGLEDVKEWISPSETADVPNALITLQGSLKEELKNQKTGITKSVSDGDTQAKAMMASLQGGTAGPLQGLLTNMPAQTTKS